MKRVILLTFLSVFSLSIFSQEVDNGKLKIKYTDSQMDSLRNAKREYVFSTIGKNCVKSDLKAMSPAELEEKRLKVREGKK